MDEEDNLMKLEPGIEDFIGRRIHHLSFQKLIYWLGFKSKDNQFIYASELTKFMKFTYTRAYQSLNDLCNVGLLRKKMTGSLVEYWFEVNGNSPIIIKYVERAKKLLGLS